NRLLRVLAEPIDRSGGLGGEVGLGDRMEGDQRRVDRRMALQFPVQERLPPVEDIHTQVPLAGEALELLARPVAGIEDRADAVRHFAMYSACFFSTYAFSSASFFSSSFSNAIPSGVRFTSPISGSSFGSTELANTP